MTCSESDDWTKLDPRVDALAAAEAAPWRKIGALRVFKLECNIVISTGSEKNSAWTTGASSPSTATAEKAVVADIGRPFLDQESGPAGRGARDPFAWSARESKSMLGDVTVDTALAKCAFSYSSTPGRSPAESMCGLGSASSATMDALKKAKAAACASYEEYLAAAPLYVKTRGANRLRNAPIKGGKSRGGGVAKSSTVAKGVHLGWTGPMRGRAQKAEQTSSLTVQPATSSPAMDVEPPTERAPAEGEAPAPAGAADLELPVVKNVEKPGENPPPPNKPEQERPVRVLFKNLSGKTFSVSVKGGTNFRELTAETAIVCEGGGVWFDVLASGRAPFEPDDIVPKDLPVDAEVKIIGRMRGAGGSQTTPGASSSASSAPLLVGGAARSSMSLRRSIVSLRRSSISKGPMADNDDEETHDVKTLRELREKSRALKKWWSGDRPPHSWRGVTCSSSGSPVYFLNLHGCSQLTALPAEVGNLQSLTVLNLNHCSQLTALPAEVGNLQSLTVLNLNHCSQLTALPAEVGNLQALTLLVLHDCNKLKLTLPFKKFGANIDFTAAPHNVPAYARLLIVEPHKDAPAQLLPFLREKQLSVPAFFRDILSQPDLADWLGKAVAATPDLARLTDANGRRAIDVAHAECRQKMQAALFLLGRFDVDEGKLLHRSATAAVAAATDHRSAEAGYALPPRRVALKAMRDVKQVRAELEGRVGLHAKHVVAVVAVFADAMNPEWQTVEAAAKKLGVKADIEPGLSSSIRDHLNKAEASSSSATPTDRYALWGSSALGAPHPLPGRPSERTLDASSEYNFLVVLELADRSLKDTIDKEHIVDPKDIAHSDWPHIRSIASDLARALDHVHTVGKGIHADFKPLNAVAVGFGFQLIEL